MAFITQAVTVLQTLVVALGAGLAVWGVVNLMEGYGNDNPGAKSQGIKQLMAGGGVVLIGPPSFLCSPASLAEAHSVNSPREGENRPPLSFFHHKEDFYGFYQSSSHRFADSRCSARRWSGRVGRGQPNGRLRQR